jgi:hypothetical protein
MKTAFTFLAFQLAVGIALAQTNIPPAESQIRSAVLAAPTDKRDAATVYGYADKSGTSELVVLRKGTNEMICLADDPNQTGFSASCYHRNLEPFMKRGRELKKAGKSPKEISDIREKEAKSAKLVMPKLPSTLYVYFAPEENYDREKGEVKDGNFRYVVYIPYATAESTGLPLKPEAPGMPWIMDPGTHRAHIMINPPTTK